MPLPAHRLPARRQALAAGWLAAALPAAACTLPPEAGERLAGHAVQAAWRAEPAPIAVSQPFALVVTLCPADAKLRRVDATMPEHRHGMNYRPVVQPLGNGRWRAEGLLWHMGGRWELRLEVESAGAKLDLRQSVVLR